MSDTTIRDLERIAGIDPAAAAKLEVERVRRGLTPEARAVRKAELARERDVPADVLAVVDADVLAAGERAKALAVRS